MRRTLLILLFANTLFAYNQTPLQWYNDAQKRIDTLRKGNFGIVIYRNNGEKYTGDVKVRMVKHEYPFGIAFDLYQDESFYPTDEQWKRAVILKYFNYGVNENSFKWSSIQPQPTSLNYSAFDRTLNWAQKWGLELRAHTLLWGGYNYEDDHAIPRWVKDLPTPKMIYDTCRHRVIREVTRYKGKIKEYDVINEPLHAKYLQSVVGDSINWNCFKWARSADSTAELYINDYNVEYIWGDAGKYRDLINTIKTNGGPITGAGMQCHFWDGLRPNITDFINQINTIAQTGLKIKFTEFDYGGDLTELQQAEDLIKVFTIGFSHPSVTGIICWSLWDKTCWRKNSGLFLTNRKPKKAADTLYYLTKKLWATNFDTSIKSENDTLKFNAYYGEYKIIVNINDTLKYFKIPCIKKYKDSIFVLHEKDAIVCGPELIKVTKTGDKEITLKFNKPILESSVNYRDFRFFAETTTYISSMNVSNDNDSIVIMKLSRSITPGEYITVVYFPGSLKSKDGGLAEFFGPEPIYNPQLSSIHFSINDENISIYPNPVIDNLTIKTNDQGFLRIYTINGELIFNTAISSGESTINLESLNKGFYIISINTPNFNRNYKIIKN